MLVLLHNKRHSLCTTRSYLGVAKIATGQITINTDTSALPRSFYAVLELTLQMLYAEIDNIYHRNDCPKWWTRNSLVLNMLVNVIGMFLFCSQFSHNSPV